MPKGGIMRENDKENGFMDLIKDGVGHIFRIITASMFPQIAEDTRRIMDSIENRIIRIERRILMNIWSIFIIGFGGIFLILALFSYLKEFLEWSNAASFFYIGIISFVIGLLLKAGVSDG